MDHYLDAYKYMMFSLDEKIKREKNMKYLTMLEALDWCREKPGVNECACVSEGRNRYRYVRLSREGVQQKKDDASIWYNCSWERCTDFTKIEPEPEVGWEEEFRNHYKKPGYSHMADVETCLEMDRPYLQRSRPPYSGGAEEDMKGRQLKLSEAAKIVEDGGKVVDDEGDHISRITSDGMLRNGGGGWLMGPYFEYIDEEQEWKEKYAKLWQERPSNRGGELDEVFARVQVVIEEACRRIRAELKEKGVL